MLLLSIIINIILVVVLASFIQQAKKNSLSRLQKAWGQWSDATFGPGDRTKACLNHLAYEVPEILDNPYQPKEYVDGLALLLDAARMGGADANMLIKCAWRKLHINKARTWHEPDANGACLHKSIKVPHIEWVSASNKQMFYDMLHGYQNGIEFEDALEFWVLNPEVDQDRLAMLEWIHKEMGRD